jgi:hypothetical protein
MPNAEQTLQLYNAIYRPFRKALRWSTDKDLMILLKESDGLYADLTNIITQVYECWDKIIQDNLAHVLTTMHPYIEILWKKDNQVSYELEHDLKSALVKTFSAKLTDLHPPELEKE